MDIPKIVLDKFEAVKQAVRISEENTASFVQDKILLYPKLTIQLIKEKSDLAPLNKKEEIVKNGLKTLFDKSMTICIAAHRNKLLIFKNLFELYKSRILGNKNTRVIFYKSPNELQISHRMAKIQETYNNSKRFPDDYINEDWSIYFQLIEQKIAEIDKICDEMSSYLEKIEKYRDDKSRLRIAILAVVFAFMIQGAFPVLGRITPYFETGWQYVRFYGESVLLNKPLAKPE
jgi:hypothetical protein